MLTIFRLVVTRVVRALVRAIVRRIRIVARILRSVARAVRGTASRMGALRMLRKGSDDAIDELSDIADIAQGIGKQFNYDPDAFIDELRLMAHDVNTVSWDMARGNLNPGQKVLADYAMDAIDQWIDDTRDFDTAEAMDACFGAHEAIEQALWETCEAVVATIQDEIGEYLILLKADASTDLWENERFKRAVEKFNKEKARWLAMSNGATTGQYWSDLSDARRYYGVYSNDVPPSVAYKNVETAWERHIDSGGRYAPWR